jgi:DNA-binding NtrC family response regulator
MAYILIVDDEEGIRESLNLILGENHQLVFASGGKEAMLKLGDANKVQLVLLDIKMPRLNGLEVLKQIRETCPSLPVIVVTGYQSVETAREALKIGAVDYVPKPFNPKDILAAVSKHIPESSV